MNNLIFCKTLCICDLTDVQRALMFQSKLKLITERKGEATMGAEIRRRCLLTKTGLPGRAVRHAADQTHQCLTGWETLWGQAPWHGPPEEAWLCPGRCPS